MLTTLVLFVVVYGIVFSIGIYYINRLIARGPEGARAAGSRDGQRRPLAARAAGGNDASRERNLRQGRSAWNGISRSSGPR